jgi:hypothetical protein
MDLICGKEEAARDPIAGMCGAAVTVTSFVRTGERIKDLP